MNIAIHHSSNISPPLLNGGTRLVQLITDQKWRYRHEHSFKLVKDFFLCNRFLLTIQKYDVGPRANMRLLELCASMGMPQHYLEAVKEEISAADVLHVGYEQGVKGDVYKLYLEYPGIFREQLKGWKVGDAPLLVHQAYKWNPENPNLHTIATYQCFPQLTDDDILQRISEMSGSIDNNILFNVVERVLKQAVGARRIEDISYMEVAEKNNPRRSFDLNIYDVGMTINDIMPMIEDMFEYFGLQLGYQYMDSLNNKKLGHLSGGINRHGKEFCSVYYGVEDIR